MARLFYHVMQDNMGNLLFGVSGTMRLAGTSTPATIYGDEALTVILPNPMTNHPSFGSFKCYLGPGNYDFLMAKAGYTFETLTGLQGAGTMAGQDASNVVITGGSATLTGGVFRPNTATGDNQYGLYSELDAAGGAQRFALNCAGDAPSYFNGNVQVQATMGIQTPPAAGHAVLLSFTRATSHGLTVQPSDDTSSFANVLFRNAAGATVGSIGTGTTSTAYLTTSDARLKHDIAPMTGALDLVQRLNPVTHLWNSDNSRGYGLLAHELQRELPEAVSGVPDAVNAAGQVQPQQVDYSKLVPWLVRAVQELAHQRGTIEGAPAMEQNLRNTIALLFRNRRGDIAGSIQTDVGGTSYHTVSDHRLSHADHPLEEGLELLRLLRPVRFIVGADDSEGVGFLAHEVAEVITIRGIVTGERDAVDEDGQIVPQQMDHSKLVPYLVSAVQTLAAHVESLTARVAALEAP